MLAVVPLLLILSPVLILAALAIKLTSPGPLLFSQIRTGKDGDPFRVYKFRSMRSDRTPDVKELVPLDHPDITPVGLIIRRFKVDEMPQLFSILRGDMSLIGPRPTLPDQTDRYDEFQWRRLLVRPGCTGLAQVNSSAASSWDERIRYDVHYVKNCTLIMDMAILLKTVLVILFGEERYARPFSESPYGPRLPESDQQRDKG